MIKKFKNKATVLLRNLFISFIGTLLITTSVPGADSETKTPPVLRITVYPEVLNYAIEKHVSLMYQYAAMQEYDKRMYSDGSLTLNDINAICQVVHLNNDECDAFRKDLMIPFYDVCGKGKGKSGGKEHCINDFFYESFFALPSKYANTYVRTWEAVNLAKEYALVKNNQSVVCIPKSKSNIILCTSLDHKHFYEFKFNDINETVDRSIRTSVLSALCRMHDMEYQEKRDFTIPSPDPMAFWPHHCRARKSGQEISCQKLAKSVSKFSYKTDGKMLNLSAETARAQNRPVQEYICAIDQVVNDKSTLRTAYNLDTKTFSVVQHVLGTDTIEPIKKYVRKELSRQNIQFDERNFYCAGSTNLISAGEVITCYVNGKPVDFLFGDLSEAKGINKRGSQQALDCIDAGGNYTGERCTHLTKQQCLLLRSANLQSCPECNLIRWEGDDLTGVCTLPSSAAAGDFRKRLNIAAIVGGAVASVVITVAMPEFDIAAAGSWIILGVETTGAGIEWWQQVKIDGFADEFFLKANSCKTTDCAKNLVSEYLVELARLGEKNDLTDAEFKAADFELEYLLTLIPADTNAQWYADFLRQEDGKSILESNYDGRWTSEQIWRAVGIGMQFTGLLHAVGGWIVKNTARMANGLPKTSQILLRNAKIAENNIVKYEKLSNVDKEFYKLWQEYAPKNQTFNQFKAMTDGNLDEMKQMTKNWVSRTEFIEQTRPLREEAAELRLRIDQGDYQDWLDKRFIPLDQSAIKDFERLRDLENEERRLASYASNYSTFDPAYSKAFEAQRKINKLEQEQINLYTNLNNLPPKEKEKTLKRIQEIQKEVEQLEKSVPNQWKIAEKFPLENLGNVVNERANTFAEIIESNPEIKAKMAPGTWEKLDQEQRIKVSQQILNEYAIRTGTPTVSISADPTMPNNWGGAYSHMRQDIRLNPKNQLSRTSGDMLEVTSHEHGHMIDDIAKNEGALGEEYAYYADQIYNNKQKNGYRLALTEQSSYKIGPNVSNKVTSYGREYDLEKCEKQSF